MSASTVDDVRTFLITNGITDGIYLHHVPGTGNPISLFGYTGMPPLFKPETTGPAYRRPRVQVRVRHSDPAAAEAKANEIHAILAGQVNIDISGTRYISIWPLGDPAFLDKDENDNTHWVCNYAIQREA